jgi:hypothetical protein
MTNRPINIIFIHRGEGSYLQYSLAAAHRSNPTANIFLLDDKENCTFNYVKHVNINNYISGAENFAKTYQHLSSNPFDFELFCIQRWFIISDFLKTNSLENFFHADSDVMIFSDLAEEWPKFSNFSLALSQGSSGHNSFWNNAKILADFCDFVSNIYNQNDKENYEKMMAFWKNIKEDHKAGGVCDMTLLRFYRETHLGTVGETAVIVNNSTYDDNISSSIQGGTRYKMSVFGIKIIYWQAGLPYGKDDAGSLIKFNTLHFQGKKKRYMKIALAEKNIYAWQTFAKEKIISILKKIGLFKFYLKLKK